MLKRPKKANEGAKIDKVDSEQFNNYKEPDQTEKSQESQSISLQNSGTLQATNLGAELEPGDAVETKEQRLKR